MPKRYNIEFFDSEELICYYPATVSTQNSVLNRIAFGSKMEEVRCKIQPNGRNIISISTELAKRLYIPPFIKTITLFESDRFLIFGPLIGIFSSGFTKFPIHPIGERSSLFSKLLSIHSSVGVVPFLFGEEHIDWDQQLINGFFYTQDGWTQVNFPLPNVIYDRLPNRRSEKLKKSKLVKEKLEKEYHIPWYNPGFFNKLDVYERLFNDKRAALYLPETSTFISFHQIERMLSNYGHIYIKPINGSLGIGIYQIIYDKKNNHYYCRYHDSRNHLLKFPSLEALFNHIFANKNLDRMIVQQGIHLLKVEGRPLDFRVHANKDEHGKWKVSAIAAKIAGIGSPTTHVKAGGEIKTIEEIFKDKEEQIKFKKRLEHAALDLSYSLEMNFDGIIGEIGFDFGIDTKGQIWLFEANSKPGRSIFSHPSLKEFDLLTRKLSLSYSIFLTEKHLNKYKELFI